MKLQQPLSFLRSLVSIISLVQIHWDIASLLEERLQYDKAEFHFHFQYTLALNGVWIHIPNTEEEILIANSSKNQHWSQESHLWNLKVRWKSDREWNSGKCHSHFYCGANRIFHARIFYLGTQKKGKSFDDATHPIHRSCPYRDENSISENANIPNMIQWYTLLLKPNGFYEIYHLKNVN